MVCRTLKYSLSAFLLVALCGILGCDGDDDGGNSLPPVADISGAWEGEASDPGTGTYAIEFFFRQNGNAVNGISSLPGLAKFTGKIDGNVLTIQGTDIYAYIFRAGDVMEIRGTFTSAGFPGGTAADADGVTVPAAGGQTATFYLLRVVYEEEATETEAAAE